MIQTLQLRKETTFAVWVGKPILDDLGVVSLAVILDPKRNNIDKKLGIPPHGGTPSIDRRYWFTSLQKWFGQWEDQDVIDEFDKSGCERPARMGVIIGASLTGFQAP